VADWCTFDRFVVLIPKTILGSLTVSVMISCRCVILTNYWQFTRLRLSQTAVFADALFFLLTVEYPKSLYISVCNHDNCG